MVRGGEQVPAQHGQGRAITSFCEFPQTYAMSIPDFTNSMLLAVDKHISIKV